MPPKSNRATAKGKKTEAAKQAASKPVPKGKGKQRALSPSAAPGLAIAKALTTLTSRTKARAMQGKTAAQEIRRAPIAAAGDLFSLLSCIPSSAYREAIRPFLVASMQARRQSVSINRQLVGLLADKEAGRIPAYLRQKAPTIQHIKGYLSAHPEASNPWDDVMNDLNSTLLDRAIGAKKSELAWAKAQSEAYEGQGQPEVDADGDVHMGVRAPSPVWRALLAAIDEVYHQRSKEAKREKWGPPTADSRGRNVFLGWVDDKGSAEAEWSSIVKDLGFIWDQALVIVDNELLAEELKVQKKNTVREQAVKDVGEATSSKDIASIVQAEVAKALQNANKGKGKVSTVGKQGAGSQAKADVVGEKSSGTRRGKRSGKQTKANNAKKGGPSGQNSKGKGRR
ncbi:hypothetical protein P691DRAFT_690034 [Macrolepiota fuliginosa MF-IS2]|uniref:Uncharacterized protein n=1 Tax=Macrolepiota fuliginosa MF-IS2 TaxID=1400762 RepID=A0A9P5WXQ3_9AGAR|nr:hypothetical protein P691DRAFT_690034 [Macrolepiota fuliginosa MF-IS2]